MSSSLELIVFQSGLLVRETCEPSVKAEVSHGDSVSQQVTYR